MNITQYSSPVLDNMEQIKDISTKKRDSIKGFKVTNKRLDNAILKLSKKIAIKSNSEVVLICRDFSFNRWLYSPKGYDTTSFSDKGIQKYIKGKIESFKFEREKDSEIFENFVWANDHPEIKVIQHISIDNRSKQNMGHIVLFKTHCEDDFKNCAIEKELAELGNLLTVKYDQKERSHYENIFKISSDLICVIGTDGFFKSVNPAFRRTLLWGENDLLENEVNFFIHPDDIHLVETEFRKINTVTKNINFRLRFRTKNNTYRLLEWVVSADLSNKLFYAIGRDITQFEETKHELFQAKEMLEETNRVAQIGGWNLDVVANKLYWTSVTREIHEISQDEVIELDQAINFYREGKNRMKISNLIYKAITQNESFDTELQIVTKSGSEKWIRAIGKPKFLNGSCVRVIGTFQDIEKDKQSSLALEETNRHLKTILNASTETSIIATDLKGVITNFNTGAENLLGYEAQEVVGSQNLLLFIDQSNIDKLHQNIYKEYGSTFKTDFEAFTFRTMLGEAEKGEFLYVQKDGNKIDVEISISPINNEMGDILGFLFIANDITEKKRQELKILDSEKRLRIFFDSSQVVMYTHDMEGNFITINAVGAYLLGYQKHEIENRNIVDIIPFEYKSEFPEYLKELEVNGKSKGLMQILDKKGKLITWMYNNVVTELADGTRYVIGNVMDITDRIELENDLHEAKKIAEKNAKMKDLFLSNMSHEIRTPMNAITGFGRLLASTKLDNEQAEYTNSINIASTNLLNIINDILDFSKIESGQIVIEHIKFSLKEQIQNVRKILTFNAEIKNLEFKYYFDEKLPDMVMGDPTRLNQVMVNLLNNAIKFTEEGFVELRVEVVKKLENKTEVKFEINDSGIGIAPNKLEVIFDRFTQANTNTTRKYGGTGLGLSISKSLAELLGGELIVASEEGKGSTFSFNLLFENPVEVVESEIKLVAPETGLYDIKILLVEDNLLNQKLALRVLQKRGFLADLAENGAEAVAILKTNTYDLILMDLQMPEMDGYQATTYIRNEMKLQTPIIAMTAHSIVGEKSKCLDIGMNDYLPKPFDPDLLHTKILEYTKKDKNDN